MRWIRFILIFGAILWLLLQSQVTTGPPLGVTGPTFKIRTTSGQVISSNALLGRTVVLEFWATWCPACVSSLPALNAFHDSIQHDDTVVYGVHVPKGAFAPAVESFMTQRNYDFPVILDRDAQLSRAFEIESIPTLIVIGPDGRVHHVKNGALGGSAHEGAQRIQSWVTQAVTDKPSSEM